MTSVLDVRFQLDHRFASPNLSAYIDGELSERQRRRIERHLQACAACRQELATLRQTIGLLRNMPTRPAPRSFVLPLSVGAEQVRHTRWSRAYGALRTSAAAVSLLLVALLTMDALFSTGTIALPDERGARTAHLPQVMEQEAALGPTVEAEAIPQMTFSEAAPAAAPMAEAAAEPEAPVAAEAVLQESDPVPEKPLARTVPQALAKGHSGPEGASGGGAPGQKTTAPTGEVVALASSPKERYGATRAADRESQGSEEPPEAGPRDSGAEEAAPIAAAEAASPVAAAVTAKAAPSPTAAAEAALSQATPEATRIAEPIAVSQDAPPWGWRIWRIVRLTAAVSLGLFLILLAGTLWAAHKRRV